MSNDHGEKLVTWRFSDRPIYNYSRRWYLIMTAIGLALLVFSVFTKNPLFAFIIVIGWALFFYRARLKPAILEAAVTEDGVEAGKDFYSYDDLKNFWVIYKPPAKMLYLSFKSALRPVLGITLDEANPVQIRTQLRRYLEEDLAKEDEAASDAIGRLFKI